jgi:hypothetical protein
MLYFRDLPVALDAILSSTVRADLIRPRRIRRWFATVDTSLNQAHKERR